MAYRPVTLVAPTTARMVRAQVLLCMGCCCGRTDRGRPEVPFEWLKSQWKEHKLSKHVQLTLSGCLGPCDIPNVVLLLTSAGQIWLGNLDQRLHYETLLGWAIEMARGDGVLQPLPALLDQQKFTPFHTISQV